MEFNIGMDGDVVTVGISGDLVASSAEEFKAQVAKLRDKNFHFILIELSRVGFMDSSGLGACMAAHKMLSERNGMVVLARLNETVGKIFRLTRADQKLKVTPTQHEGIKILQDAILAEKKK
ncbi:MAG: anti-sigma factor antagonist [Desulfobacteraceae bacterium]|nr:MAG: anti-sigma factor antagonist [Desulfobacteraceae bacterium]